MYGHSPYLRSHSQIRCAFFRSRFVSDGLDVTVTKVDHRRVLEIRVEVLPEETDNRK